MYNLLNTINSHIKNQCKSHDLEILDIILKSSQNSV